MEAPGSDRCWSAAAGTKSVEVDELAQAHKTIAELEAEPAALLVPWSSV